MNKYVIHVNVRGIGASFYTQATMQFFNESITSCRSVPKTKGPRICSNTAVPKATLGSSAGLYGFMQGPLFSLRMLPATQRVSESKVTPQSTAQFF